MKEPNYSGLRSSLLRPYFCDLVSEVGLGFAGGVTGGSIYYLTKDIYKSKSLASGFALACTKAPLIGGKWAALIGFLYVWTPAVKNSFDQKLVPLTSFLAGAAAGAASFRRHGLAVASCAALAVGCCISFVHSVPLVMDKLVSRERLPHAPQNNSSV